jgi:hypothetical protein
VQDFVEELKGTMQMNFNPARGVFDRLAWVIGSPALDETQPKDAQSSKVINSDTSGCRKVCYGNMLLIVEKVYKNRNLLLD